MKLRTELALIGKLIMRNQKLIYSILAGLFVLVLILAGIIFVQKSQALKIIFLDVGQGDAILISQGANQVLIDGGKDGRLLLEKLGRYIPFWDRKIEAAIATHPDADHIGGLVSAARAYKIENIIETLAQNKSQIYAAWENSISNANKIEAVRGVNIKFSNGAEMTTLFPFAPIENINDKNSNAGSVVEKLIFGGNKFLFTGDLPNEQELVLIRSGLDLDSRVLKVAHHGSKYSTSREFLDAVKPETAVISAGRNNTYGHPNQEILSRLAAGNIKIIRTDESGDVVYECPAAGEKCNLIAN